MSSGTLLFGGTFDPPHRAHASLPPLAAEALGCARLIYIPAAMNPLKVDAPPTAADHRLAMLDLAIRNVGIALISTVELDRAGPSYFVDTARQFRQDLGGQAEIRFLIGSDQAAAFHRWKDWRVIMDLVEPAVMIRPPMSRDEMLEAIDNSEAAELHDFWDERILDLPLIDTSSTDVRELYARGSSSEADALLDPAVAAYIRRHGLYGQRGANAPSV